MNLRSQLTPNPVPPERLATLTDLVKKVEASPEASHECTILIREFNSLTGQDYVENDFRNYWRAVDLEEFVYTAALGKALPVPDVSEAELVEIISRAMPTHPSYERHNATYYMALFDACVPRPKASNLIYYPPDDFDQPIADWDPTPEHIVQLALDHRPIILGPG